MTYNSAARGGGLTLASYEPSLEMSSLTLSPTLSHPSFFEFDRAHPILTSHTLYIHSQHLALNVLSTFWLIELLILTARCKALQGVPRSESRFLMVIDGTMCQGTKVKTFYRPTVPSLSFRFFHGFHFGIVVKSDKNVPVKSGTTYLPDFYCDSIQSVASH